MRVVIVEDLALLREGIVRLLEEGGGGDTVEPRHADVHEDDVRGQHPGPLDRLAAVGGLADDGEVVLGVEQGPQPAPDAGCIADHSGCPKGS